MMSCEIFIDESGALTDPNDRFVVVAAVASSNPSSLIKLIPRARKRISLKKKRLKRERLISEFKFRNVGDKTKERILREIAKSDVKLFVLVCDKENRRVEDNPESYAILVSFLVSLCLPRLVRVSKLIIDRHFNQPDKQRKLNREIRKLLNREVMVTHVDSLTDSRVDIADFVAGATLREARGKGSGFKEIIKSKIVVEKRVIWRKLKEKVVKLKPDRGNPPS